MGGTPYTQEQEQRKQPEQQPEPPRKFHVGMKDALVGQAEDLPPEYREPVEKLGASLDSIEEFIAAQNFPRFVQVFFEAALSGFAGSANGLLESTKYLTHLMIMYTQDPAKAKAFIPLWEKALAEMAALSVTAASRAADKPTEDERMKELLAEGKHMLDTWKEVSEANKGENELVITRRFMTKVMKEKHPEMFEQREAVDDVATSNPTPGDEESGEPGAPGAGIQGAIDDIRRMFGSATNDNGGDSPQQ